MRLCQATLREIQMPLVRPFETSFGRTTVRRILLVEVNVDGAIGWGECVAGERPSYSPETIETAWLVLRDFIWPALSGKEFGSASEVWEMLAPIRGHNMAKGAIEAAIWDAEARQKSMPLWKLLGGTIQEISCGVSIGIQESDDELERVVERELAAGYQRIKIKIKPGYDVQPVARLRRRFPKVRLMVDANSAYTLADAARLRELEAYYLMMIEQPLGWDDIWSHAELQRQLMTPICLDECIHTEEHAQAAIALGACRIINIKLGRVGGFTPARRIHDLCLRTRHSRVVRRHAGIGHRPRAQYRALHAGRFHAARRRHRQQALLDRGRDRSGSDGHAAGNDSRAAGPGHRVRAAPGTHRGAHGAT